MDDDLRELHEFVRIRERIRRSRRAPPGINICETRNRYQRALASSEYMSARAVTQLLGVTIFKLRTLMKKGILKHSPTIRLFLRTDVEELHKKYMSDPQQLSHDIMPIKR